jgi:hypothetical protein
MPMTPVELIAAICTGLESPRVIAIEAVEMKPTVAAKGTPARPKLNPAVHSFRN